VCRSEFEDDGDRVAVGARRQRRLAEGAAIDVDELVGAVRGERHVAADRDDDRAPRIRIEIIGDKASRRAAVLHRAQTRASAFAVILAGVEGEDRGDAGAALDPKRSAAAAQHLAVGLGEQRVLGAEAQGAEIGARGAVGEILAVDDAARLERNRGIDRAGDIGLRRRSGEQRCADGQRAKAGGAAGGKHNVAHDPGLPHLKRGPGRWGSPGRSFKLGRGS